MDSAISSRTKNEIHAAPRRKMAKRRRPMHTCGTSISTIIDNAYTKAQDFIGLEGPMRTIATILVSFMLPFFRVYQYQRVVLLSFLSCADDLILYGEWIMETIFPSSTHLFDKIDAVVQNIENLSRNSDDMLNKVSLIIHDIPFLDRALMCLISRLNFLVSILTHWGYCNNTKEKEIVVDVACNNTIGKMASTEKAWLGQSESPPVSPKSESSNSSAKLSYKEILEKGVKEDVEEMNIDHENQNENEIENENDTRIVASKDPILDLFEFSWHMNPGKSGK